MKVDVPALVESLWKNIGAVDALCEDLAARESALADQAAELGAGDGEALRSHRALLSDVLLPAARLHHDAALALASDQRDDYAEVQSKLSALGPIADSDVLQARMDARLSSALYLEERAAGLRSSPFRDLGAGTMASLLSDLAEAYRGEARTLQGHLDTLVSYGTDAGIYALSTSYAQALASSTTALGQVRFNTATSSYDLTGVDLSWVPVYDDAYWRRRNRLIVERYFDLDSEGKIVGVRPGAADEVAGLLDGARKALFESNDPDAFADFVAGLTPDQKYLLVWMGAELAEPVGALIDQHLGDVIDVAASAGLSVSEGYKDALGWIFDGLPPDAREALKGCGLDPHNLPDDVALGPFTDYFSFAMGNGLAYSKNVDTSVQEGAGFCDLYELYGPALGMDIDSQIVTFEHGGREYRLEKWDGSYAYGALYGGEVGLYSRDLPRNSRGEYRHMSAADIRANVDTLTPDQVESICTVYTTVDGDDQPEMTIRIQDDEGKTLIHRDAGKTYWNLSLASVHDEDSIRGSLELKEDLSVEVELDFKGNNGLENALREAVEESGYVVSDAGNEGFSIYWREDS